MAVLAICEVVFDWRDFWGTAAQPYATLIAGSAALGAGLLALFNGDLQRAAEDDRLASQQAIDSAEAQRVHRRETAKDLRARFTSVTTQLADEHATIRRSGVYGMAALANDWLEAGEIPDAQVCVDVLTAYLATPNMEFAPPTTPFSSAQAGADGSIREIIIRLLSEHVLKPPPSDRTWELLRYNMASADLRGVRYKQAQLFYARMEGTNFREADFCDALLNNAILTFAKFEGAQLDRSNLRDADLTSALFSRTSMVGADLSRANLRNARFPDAKLSGATFTRARLHGTFFGNANLDDASLTSAELNEAVLTNCDLSRADLTNADLTGAFLTGCNLRHANLRGANLYNADLSDADLSFADLTEAQLDHAILSGAVCSRTRLVQTNLCGAQLHLATQLDEADLTHAFWDAETTWPQDPGAPGPAPVVSTRISDLLGP